MNNNVSFIDCGKIIVAIDFDGTIVEHKYPKIGDFIKDAKKYINKLYDEGYYIIIWTCRAGHQLIDMINFLDESGVKYHKINENADFDIIGFKPAPKIFAHYYVDDANLSGLPSWEKVYYMIRGGN